MVDCGEGTQHQFKLSTLKIGKLRNIFITHLHGDHCYGLFGLLHSIRPPDALDDDQPLFTLNIYGPKGIRKMIETTLRLSGGLYHYNLNIVELELPSPPRNVVHSDTVPVVDGDTECSTKFGGDSILFLIPSRYLSADFVYFWVIQQKTEIDGEQRL